MTKRPWTPAEIARLRELWQSGYTAAQIAQHLGRSRPSVTNRLQTEMAKGLTRGAVSEPAPVPAPLPLPALDAVVEQLAGTEREWTERDGGNAATLKTTVTEPVRTLDDLARVCEIDTDVWHIQKWKANSWEAAAKGADGELHAKTLYQISADMVRKSPTENPALVLEAITRGLAGVIVAKRAPMARVRGAVKVLRQRIVNDLHMGGHAWAKSTGGESWSLEKAHELATASNAYLDAHAMAQATETGIAFLGDICHYDTPRGNTTSGTQLDMDSRADLMIETATRYMLETIEAEAEVRPVTVHIVEGNHDAMLTKALRQTARFYFAKHKGVTIVDEYTKRQFRRWYDNLLGFAHGELATRKLAELMPVEASALWSGSVCREYHRGHLHNEAAQQKLHQVKQYTHEPTVTHAGVVVRTHMAMTPSDQWHADEGWIGAQRGMSDWYYHEAGGMIGSVIATPRVLEVARAAA